MAKGAYIGIGGVARKVKKGYIGIEGLARKIKKAYIGVNGTARVFWSADNPVYNKLESFSDDTTSLSYTSLPFEPKYIAVKVEGELPSASGIYTAAIYADKDSGKIYALYKNNSQSGLFQYSEFTNGSPITITWGTNSISVSMGSYRLYRVPYRIAIWR